MTLALAPYSALADLAKSLEAQLTEAASLGEAIRIRRNLDRVRAEQNKRTERLAGGDA